MTPTFKNTKDYRFGIFSNEERRMHVHVFSGNKHAKIWLEPVIEFAKNNGFTKKQLNEILLIVKDNEEDFRQKYRAHIG